MNVAGNATKKFCIQVNSSAWADENQLKWEKVRFLSEMSEIWKLLYFTIQDQFYSAFHCNEDISPIMQYFKKLNDWNIE